MKITHLVGILILLATLGTSCKSYKNLEKVKPKSESASMEEQLQKLKPGDRIKVFEKNGSIRLLTYVHTEAGILRGLRINNSKEQVSIRLDDISQVQVKKNDVASTAILSTFLGVTLGIVGLILLNRAAWGGYN
jgi:hypothetical protein